MEILLTPEEQKLNLDCVTVYGPDNQLEQYAEECIEGALAVRRFLRAKKSMNHEDIKEKRKELLSEIIDTLNMSIQMKLSMMNDDAFNELWSYKINRQIDRVNKKLNPL